MKLKYLRAMQSHVGLSLYGAVCSAKLECKINKVNLQNILYEALNTY